MRHLARLCFALLAVLVTSAATAQQLTTNFDDITTLPGAGWVFTNVSTPGRNHRGLPGQYRRLFVAGRCAGQLPRGELQRRGPGRQYQPVGAHAEPHQSPERGNPYVLDAHRNRIAVPGSSRGARQHQRREHERGRERHHRRRFHASADFHQPDAHGRRVPGGMDAGHGYAVRAPGRRELGPHRLALLRHRHVGERRLHRYRHAESHQWPATHFSVSAPASATAGSAFSFTVTALDAGNATDTGYSGTVHFTSSDGAATLPADVTLVNGVGTFSATLRTAGTQTLTATDTVTASITGTSNNITVNAAAATHYTVTAPAAATGGVAFSFTVTALDAFNNTAPATPGRRISPAATAPRSCRRIRRWPTASAPSARR